MEAEADAGDRGREVRELPPVERQTLDPRQIDHLAHGRGRDRKEREFRGHGNRFRQRGQPQNDVEIARLSDVDDDVGALETREARLAGRDGVGANRQGGEAVQAVFIRGGLADETRDRARRGHDGAGKGRVLIIDDASGNRSCRLLCEGRNGQDQRACEEDPRDVVHGISGKVEV